MWHQISLILYSNDFVIVPFCNYFQVPVFLEKFTITDLVPSDMDDKCAIEFQIYSSHNVTRRHLVGMSSIFLKDLCELENGLADLTIMPETVYRVSKITLHKIDYNVTASKCIHTGLKWSIEKNVFTWVLGAQFRLFDWYWREMYSLDCSRSTLKKNAFCLVMYAIQLVSLIVLSSWLVRNFK